MRKIKVQADAYLGDVVSDWLSWPIDDDCPSLEGLQVTMEIESDCEPYPEDSGIAVWAAEHGDLEGHEVHWKATLLHVCPGTVPGHCFAVYKVVEV